MALPSLVDRDAAPSDGERRPASSRLPPELWIRIVELLSPVGSFTVLESTADRLPVVNQALLESRRALLNVGRVCHLFRQVASPILYRVVIMRAHEDLILFFRTLAMVPGTRLLVRSFAWIGQLRDHNSHTYDQLDHDLKDLTYNCWNAIRLHWPTTNDDKLISRLMPIEGFQHLMPWNLLGAILMAMGCSDQPEIPWRATRPLTPESDCLDRLLDGRRYKVDAYADAGQMKLLTYGSDRFLQQVETITLQPYPTDNGTFFCVGTLRMLLLSSKAVRRVELHVRPSWDAINGELDPETLPAVIRNVSDVVTVNNAVPLEDIPKLVRAFPQLASLHAEYRGGVYTFYSSEPASEYDLSRCMEVGNALQGLKHSLRVLHLTTSPGRSWNAPCTYPSLLSPALENMKVLKHLTVESIWLFGRGQPSNAFRVADLLPSSINNFHLIDYWGVAEDTFDEERTTSFYPAFPNDESPVEALGMMLESLREGCCNRLNNLEDVKISSNLFSDRHSSQDFLDETEALKIKHRQSFTNISRRLSFAEAQAVTHIPSAAWALVR